jgi:hypothetical protein
MKSAVIDTRPVLVAATLELGLLDRARSRLRVGVSPPSPPPVLAVH